MDGIDINQLFLKHIDGSEFAQENVDGNMRKKHLNVLT